MSPGLATSLSLSCGLTIHPPFTLPLTLLYDFRAEVFMSKTYNARLYSTLNVWQHLVPIFSVSEDQI